MKQITTIISLLLGIFAFICIASGVFEKNERSMSEWVPDPNFGKGVGYVEPIINSNYDFEEEAKKSYAKLSKKDKRKHDILMDSIVKNCSVVFPKQKWPKQSVQYRSNSDSYSDLEDRIDELEENEDLRARVRELEEEKD